MTLRSEARHEQEVTTDMPKPILHPADDLETVSLDPRSIIPNHRKEQDTDQGTITQASAANWMTPWR